MINQLRRYAFAVICFLPMVYMQVGELANKADLRDSQQAFFQYFVMCLTALFVGNVWLASFLVLNVLLYIQNGQSVGSMQILNVLFGCLLFLFSRTFFRANKVSDYYKYILLIVVINGGWMALQMFGIDPLFQGQTSAGEAMHGTFSDPVGIFGIKMAGGIFNTIALPILASINIYLAPLLFILIFLSKSSIVFVAAGLVSLFYTFHLHKKAFVALLVAIPITIVSYLSLDLKTDPKTFTSRFPVWHSAVAFTMKNPNTFLGLTGWGPDSYRNFTKHKHFKFVGDNFYNHGILTREGNELGFRYYVPSNDIKKYEELTNNIHKTGIPQGRMDEWDNPHNEYLNLLFQYGFIGLGLLLGLMNEMYKRFKYAIKDKELIVLTSCLLVYFITGICHFPVELARTGYLFPILLGMFYARTDAK